MEWKRDRSFRALALARSAQAERDNESCFFHLYWREYRYVAISVPVVRRRVSVSRPGRAGRRVCHCQRRENLPDRFVFAMHRVLCISDSAMVIRGVHIEPSHVVRKRSIDQPLRISVFYDHSVYRHLPAAYSPPPSLESVLRLSTLIQRIEY
ncbi:hypothetical protein EVAR_22266_1 [Eumeta japonica]|uniref:Uncharacterized protein n=1 Tax=Eumeta variegata TaxID=151549 RepID=A0A4C1UBC2_EUMVA|nr:hypothetical protein EVAR_22266_1 [Eumeta japonica]